MTEHKKYLLSAWSQITGNQNAEIVFDISQLLF